MPRQRLPVVFGPGLDRDAGLLATRPGSFEDIRNVLLRESKVEIRRGFTAALTLTDPGGNALSHVVAGQTLRSDRIGLVVGYQDLATGGVKHGQAVYVYLVAADGSDYQFLGEWEGTWDPEEPPRIIMAESDGRIFMAHDEETITRREATLYYDPVSSPGTPLQELTADLDGQGAAPVRFRGVVRHLDYLFGWGYGTPSENRPELIRSSLPGDPTSFQPEHYFIAGSRREPVIACAPAGGLLKVFKETQTYNISGYSRSTFGIRISDPDYGVLSSRLVANKSDVVVAWGAEGPRAHGESIGSTPLEVPLELDGLDPTSLVQEGSTEDAFALYVPPYRVMLFVFGQRVYALTTEREGNWKWSYWTLGFTPRCGFNLVAGTSVTEAPTGFPAFDSADPAGLYADITVNHSGQDGDEVLEVWTLVTSVPGSAWEISTTAPVEPGASQVVRIPGSGDLAHGEDYKVALRYRRGVKYADAYSSQDPNDWPDVSIGTFSSYLDPPEIVSVEWGRDSETVEHLRITVEPNPDALGDDIEIVDSGGVVVHQEVNPQGQFSFDDTSVTGETTETYKVRSLSAPASKYSDPVKAWVGPSFGLDDGTGLHVIYAYPHRPTWTIAWALGVLNGPGLFYQLGDDWDDMAEAVGAFTVRRDDIPATIVGKADVENPLDGDLNGQTITVGIRHKRVFSAFNDKTDYSPWITRSLHFEDLS